MPSLAVYPNLNLYYHPDDPKADVSADVMVVRSDAGYERGLRSYTVDVDGPMPVLAVEVLSDRTAQQGDLGVKSEIYRLAEVADSILVDTTGEHLAERLQIRRLRPDGTWAIGRDPDGGVTSRLGFRFRVEPDDEVRVVRTDTGRGYARPFEAEEAVRRADEEARLHAEAVRRADDEAKRADNEARLRVAAEERLREIEAELARLRAGPNQGGQP